MRAFGGTFVVSVMTYWLLVGQVSVAEACLALGGGAWAALWAVALSRAGEISFRFEWKALLTFAAAIAGVPRAAAQVTWVLLNSGRHRPHGSIVDLPFDHGREHSAADATRRAAVLLAVSLAPDRFALVHQGDRLSVHRLVASRRGGDERWPA